MHTAANKGLQFYHQAPLHTFQELRDLQAAGVSEVILGAPLFFQLDSVQKNFPTLQIRAIANIALPEGSMAYHNGVCGTWIRPEDIELYNCYISTIEFRGVTQSQEQALFRIYAQQKKWAGQLNDLILDMDHPATNRLIPSSLAEVRINCKQRCMENNNCHLCQRTLDMANPLIFQQILES